MYFSMFSIIFPRFFSVENKYPKITEFFELFVKFNGSLENFAGELERKDQDLSKHAEKLRLLRLLQKETENNLALLNNEVVNLKKDLAQTQQDKFEISSILQKE